LDVGEKGRALGLFPLSIHVFLEEKVVVDNGGVTTKKIQGWW